MIKKMNNKGFTLIELLAVIIVLAIIMVFAVPAILDTSNKAQEKSFQLYAQRVMQKAMEKVETERMSNTEFSNTSAISYDQSDLGLGTNSGYGVCVAYTRETDNAAGYTLKLSITNGTYCYEAVEADGITAKTNYYKTGCKKVSEVTKNNTGCNVAH